jgi:ribosomal protein S18 acetylase RimI-like enzyme
MSRPFPVIALEQSSHLVDDFLQNTFWGTGMANCTISAAFGHEDKARELFTEYTEALLRQAPDFTSYLAMQNFGHELDNLEEKYGPPDGRLYIATVDGNLAGCIALRKINDHECEMKRLYVRPPFRGCGIAGLLVKTIIADAKDIGYRSILLDTFPFMQDAIRLYRKFGFQEIESYNGRPMENRVYMKLGL